LIVELKTLALRDDPLIHEYRDHHYQIVLDQLQATGQLLANGTMTAALSSDQREWSLKQRARLHKQICNKYRIDGFQGGNPFIVKPNRVSAFHDDPC